MNIAILFLVIYLLINGGLVPITEPARETCNIVLGIAVALWLLFLTM